MQIRPFRRRSSLTCQKVRDAEGQDAAPDDVISLLALLPDSAEAEKVLSGNDAATKLFRERAQIAQHQRLVPPATMRKTSFCAKPGTPPAATP